MRLLKNCLSRSQKHYNDCSLKLIVILKFDLCYMHSDGEEMKETILIHTSSTVKQLYLQVWIHRTRALLLQSWNKLCPPTVSENLTTPTSTVTRRHWFKPQHCSPKSLFGFTFFFVLLHTRTSFKRTEMSPSRVNLGCNTNHSVTNLCFSFCSGLTIAVLFTLFPLDCTVFFHSDYFNHYYICIEVYLTV